MCTFFNAHFIKMTHLHKSCVSTYSFTTTTTGTTYTSTRTWKPAFCMQNYWQRKTILIITVCLLQNENDQVRGDKRLLLRVHHYISSIYILKIGIHYFLSLSCYKNYCLIHTDTLNLHIFIQAKQSIQFLYSFEMSIIASCRSPSRSRKLSLSNWQQTQGQTTISTIGLS